MPSASPDLLTPEFRRGSEQPPTGTDATLKKQKNPLKAPGPSLEKIFYREGPKGGEGYILKLSFADQIRE